MGSGSVMNEMILSFEWQRGQAKTSISKILAISCAKLEREMRLLLGSGELGAFLAALTDEDRLAMALIFLARACHVSNQFSKFCSCSSFGTKPKHSPRSAPPYAA